MADGENQNELTRILSRVVAMRNNAPEGFVDVERGEEYNVLVRRAEPVRGEPLDEFLIDPSDIRKPTINGAFTTPYIIGNLYKQRLDAFIFYIQATLPASLPRQMGFEARQK